MRTKAVPMLVLVLSVAAMAATFLLQQSSGHNRDLRLRLADLENGAGQLQTAPYRAAAGQGRPGDPHALVRDGARRLRADLRALGSGSPPRALTRLMPLLADDERALMRLSDALARPASAGTARAVQRRRGEAARPGARIVAAFDAARREYGRRAERDQTLASLGRLAVILILLGAFALFYGRSVRARRVAEDLAAENRRLLAASRAEANSDALTGLRNRRALTADLAARLAEATDGRPWVLALFDLDGFKQYNDTFGHPAGDALLTRLGDRLRRAVDGAGEAYRMGGDEFCVLAPAGGDGGRSVAARAAAALVERGEGFAVSCSHGLALLPAEAPTAEQALRLADQRMYRDKGGRASVGRQTADALLAVLGERDPAMPAHLGDVARLAERTAERLGLPAEEVRRIGLAAELHDVGKAAIPDTILTKASALDEAEWSFMRRHTLIGERIVLAAESLAHTAELVRSSHERFDGHGYPDGLAGADIPLGACIIAVCDAFDAMTSERPYRASLSVGEALAELRRCAGTQFHPAIVDTFCALAAEPDPAHSAAA